MAKDKELPKHTDKDAEQGASRQVLPEGPHARPDLTDHEKTPGTGSLPDSDTKGIDIGPG